MKLAIASDHGGFRLKQVIIEHFADIEFLDLGTDSEDSCDYPDCVSQVGYTIKEGKIERGIVICGTGIGASITVNKIPGIRGALCFNEFMAEMSRRHNNANVLALGGRVIGDELAVRIVEKWLNTPFDGGRHQRRIDKIADIEKSFFVSTDNSRGKN